MDCAFCSRRKKAKLCNTISKFNCIVKNCSILLIFKKINPVIAKSQKLKGAAREHLIIFFKIMGQNDAAPNS